MRNLSGVSTIACQRCRLRKTRCDRNVPKCKSCERANAPCLTTDPTSGRAVPRSYLSHLEGRVKELETELAKRDDNNLDLGHVDGGSYLGESAGLTFASILGAALKENLPDAQTLLTTPRNPPVSDQDVVLPNKTVAERYLTIFFHEANPQLPILHRESFIRSHFEPVYGKLSPKTNLATNTTQPALDLALEEPPPGSYYRLCVDTVNYAYPSVGTRRSLFFLYSVFAVAAASRQQEYDEKLADSLHFTAMKYYKIVLSSPDRLEALQGVLLLGLYSVMRPAHPGIWHVVGTAMRMCQELGLHHERRNTKVNKFTADLTRRLFWCAYSLDRQISVYLGRPPGIPDYCARTPFPSLLDDSRIPYKMADGTEVDAPSSQLPCGPTYKRLSLGIFRLRRLQGEIQSILYDGREVPRAFGDLNQWRESMVEQLESWWQEFRSKPELNNCHFNVNYLVLNYHQTRILLFGVSPGNPRPSEGHMLVIAHAGLQLLHTYSEIFATKSLNYSWAAVHNIFLAGTSYLYVLYHSASFRAKTSITELETVVISALEVMEALKTYCDAAIACHRSFKLLSQAIIELVRRDKLLENSASPSTYSDVDDDSIVTFLNSAARPGSDTITTPALNPQSQSQMNTPLFQGQDSLQHTASPMALPRKLRDQSQSPAGLYKPEQVLARPADTTNNQQLPEELTGTDYSVPGIKEEPDLEFANPGIYESSDADNNVYDFLNEMQQSFIWNNFLNQSTQTQQQLSGSETEINDNLSQFY